MSSVGKNIDSRRGVHPVLVLVAVMTLNGISIVPASAQDSALALEEMVVTAQRREQSILDVPVAVTSYSGNVLEDRRVTSLSDINLLSPSVHITGNVSNQMSNTPVRIRGFGTGGGNPGFESAVGLVFDDVYRSRPGGVLGSFFDLESIEVLRGPQGTLFGKNTTAGALTVRAKRPNLEQNESGVTVEAGNFGSLEVEGFTNIVLSDTAAIRIAGVFNETDGYFKRVGTGEDTDPSENKGVRVSLAWEPSDDLSVDAIVDYLDTDTAGGAGIPTRLANDDNGFAAALYAPLASEATGLPLSQAWFWDTTDPANPGDVDPFSYLNYTNVNGSKSNENYGATLKVDYDISESLNLRSITSIRKLDYARRNLDIDFGPALLFGGPGRIGMNSLYDIDSFSQEFLLSGENGKVNWTLGAHYFDETIEFTQFIGLGDQAADFGYFLAGLDPSLPRNVVGRPDALTQDVTVTQDEKSLGLFAQADISLTDSLSLIGGLRWNDIDKDGRAVNNVGTREEQFDLAFNNIRFLYQLGGAALGSPNWEASTTDEEITYDVALQFRPSDTTQFYAKFAHGFKSGGINMNPDTIDGRPSVNGTVIINGRRFNESFQDATTFEPEFVDAYELGARWNYPGGFLNVTAFKMDFEDLQVARFDGVSFKVVAAGSAESKGIEVENSYNFNDNLSTNIAFTLMNAEYGDDVLGLTAGRRLPLSPKFSSVVNVTYQRPINERYDGFLNTNWTYYGETFLADAGDIDSLLGQASSDSYNVVSLSAGLRSPDGKWEASLWCENCFEAEYFAWAFNQPVHPGGAPMANPEAPRTYGLRFSTKF